MASMYARNHGNSRILSASDAVATQITVLFSKDYLRRGCGGGDADSIFGDVFTGFLAVLYAVCVLLFVDVGFLEHALGPHGLGDFAIREGL